jgi:hypothetical protein
METIYNKDGKAIKTSRNLRGIREHINKNIVTVVEISYIDGGKGKFKVLFDNGDNYETVWASFAYLRYSLRTWRGLYSALLTINGNKSGVVAYNNPELR